MDGPKDQQARDSRYALPALVVTAAPALGGGQQAVKVDSEITAAQEIGFFHGRVKADVHACIKRRTVKLFKQTSEFSGWRLAGTDVTNNRGHWRVPTNIRRPTSFKAVVSRERSRGTAGTIYVCRRDLWRAPGSPQ